MTIQEILDFIKSFKVFSDDNPDKRSDISKLAQTTKLSEEVGELSAEVLASLNMQRKRSVQKFSRSGLEEEVADVLITILVLADMFEIDVDSALTKKFEKIKRRMVVEN